MEGTRPMRVNPIPKTSNGVKLRLNSACVVNHARSASAKEREWADLACTQGWPTGTHRDRPRSVCSNRLLNQDWMEPSGFVKPFCLEECGLSGRTYL